MGWSSHLTQLHLLCQPDNPKNRILCAYEVIKSSLSSKVIGEEANLFMEKELEICPVTMMCVFRKWNTFQNQLKSNPESLFRLVSNRPWDYGHNGSLKFPDRSMVFSLSF